MYMPCACFSSFKVVQIRGNRQSFNKLQEGKIIIALPVLKDRLKKKKKQPAFSSHKYEGHIFKMLLNLNFFVNV